MGKPWGWFTRLLAAAALCGAMIMAPVAANAWNGGGGGWGGGGWHGGGGWGWGGGWRGGGCCWGGGGVYLGFAPPIYVAPPVYIGPPVVYAPPPVYAPGPGYAPPAGYAPGGYAPGAPGQVSATCYAGAYICPLENPGPAGAPCTCPTNNGRVQGAIR